ncbi:MAG: hypothetical protein FWG05_01605, partial [Kiritimatiellaeota bacterium]|nr:hypothetical protein [Kiritimatiellota bacterium]
MKLTIKSVSVVLLVAQSAFAADMMEMPPEAVSPWVGTVMCSQAFRGGEEPFKIFDGDQYTKWCGFDRSGWVVYKFADGDRWALTNYAVRTSKDPEYGRQPRIWQVEGSNDVIGDTNDDVNAAHWTVIHQYDIAPAPNMGPPFTLHEFPLPAHENAYNAYRLNIFDTAGGGVIEMGEWILSGNSGSVQVKTLPVSDLGFDSVTLNGTYEKFVGENFDFYVCYDTMDHGCEIGAWQGADGATVAAEDEPEADGEFNVTLNGLTPLTPYVARFCASSGGFESWSEPIKFETFGAAPTIETRAAQNVGNTTATLSADFSHAGGSATEADVSLWLREDGAPSWTLAAFFPAEAPETIVSTNLTGLNHATTYHFTHSADNGGGVGESAVTNSFRTKGEAVFGAVKVVSLPTSLKFSAVIAETGVTPLTVSCWYGDSAGNLTLKADEWTAYAPGTFTCSVDELAPGEIWWFQFRAENTMPDTLTTRAVATEPRSAIVGSRELTWTYAAHVWDTTTSTWRDGGGANTVFGNGDSVFFNLTGGSFNGTLAEDIEAMDVRVKSYNNATWWMGGDDKTLTLHGDMFLETNGDSDNNRLYPKLTGDGSLTLKFGGLWIYNPDNDFAGGVNALNGTLRTYVSSANATTLGAGPLRLASDEIEPGTPVVRILGDGSLDVPELALAGRMNSAYIQLSADGGANLDVAFGDFTRNDGATLQIAPSNGSLGGVEKLSADGVENLLSDDDVLPQWVVSTTGWGYMTYDANGFAELPFYPESIYTGALPFTGDTNYFAARLGGGYYDLDGFTLGLGGAFLWSGATFANGTLDIGDDNAYFHVPGGHWAQFSTELSGAGTLTKFGGGELVIDMPDTRPYVVQEGYLRLASETPAAYDYLTGSGQFRFRNGDATLLPGGVFEMGSVHLHSGSLTVGAGAEVKNHGMFQSSPLSNNDSPGSQFSIIGGGNWTQVRGGSVFIGTSLGNGFAGNSSGAQDHHMLITGAAPDGTPSMLDMNGGQFVLGGAPGGGNWTYTNTVTVTDGGVLTNAFAID